VTASAHEIGVNTTQSPAFYRKRIGSTVVTALSDGYFDLFLALEAAEGVALLRSAHLPSAPRIQVNAFLLEQDGKRTLIDTGCGCHLGPTVNQLRTNLKAAGIDAASIDTVLCTHIHPDHTNGLVDGSGQAVFPNAEVCIHSADAAFWLDDENEAKAPGDMKIQFAWAKAAFAPYKDRTRLITTGEVLSGVEAIALHGHTPGHCGYVIHSGDDAVLIWGDAVHSIAIQSARPEVSFAADVDKEAARATRKRLFDQVATDRLLITGMHLEFPGFGYLTRDTGRFHYEPEPWSPVV
jgi:glyoxylase-like metal-dependent hydrolase (beta-lactamase superfamily II)